MKSIMKSIWDFLGTPQIWVVWTAIVVAIEVLHGPSIRGSILVFTCLSCFFLERIARAVEKIAGLMSGEA